MRDALIASGMVRELLGPRALTLPGFAAAVTAALLVLNGIAVESGGFEPERTDGPAEVQAAVDAAVTAERHRVLVVSSLVLAVLGGGAALLLHLLQRRQQGDLEPLRLAGAESQRQAQVARAEAEELRGQVKRALGAVDELSVEMAGREQALMTVVRDLERASAVRLSRFEDQLKGAGERMGVAAASVQEMAVTAHALSENADGVAESSNFTALCVDEMTPSIKQVAANVDSIAQLAEETASAMNQMDSAIRQVEGNTRSTASLSKQVAERAETGSDAVRKTIAGIMEIAAANSSSTAVVKALESKVGRIGAVLDVIENVARETNLLALNAAIIAAQAGSHGRGFAVVADEIKGLADSTGRSTREIATLVKDIQAEVDRAVAASRHVAEQVEHGIGLSREADEALRQIRESAQTSTSMVEQIAAAALQQASGTRSLAAAIAGIAQGVGDISRETSEQSKGGELLTEHAKKMRSLATQMLTAAGEHGQGSKQLSTELEEMNTLMHTLRELYEDTSSSSRDLNQVLASHLEWLSNVRETFSLYQRRPGEAPATKGRSARST
ncbi:MAG: hypothetical protein HY903_25025 [Deltaproteobacteria bacterium]|nr:hypothetical protein [Deltaproteobacteria bacterium]